ncbi:MAG TPA: hypothetical protein H9945_08880, partial [Candidatus Gemmiger avicola]|nr:hypothetical protein [Candidatus Gemmiger avicola]
YWHLHVVCCKLAMSFSIFIEPPDIFIAVGRPQFYYTRRSFHYILFLHSPAEPGVVFALKQTKQSTARTVQTVRAVLCGKDA